MLIILITCILGRSVRFQAQRGPRVFVDYHLLDWMDQQGAFTLLCDGPVPLQGSISRAQQIT